MHRAEPGDHNGKKKKEKKKNQNTHIANNLKDWLAHTVFDWLNDTIFYWQWRMTNDASLPNPFFIVQFNRAASCLQMFNCYTYARVFHSINKTKMTKVLRVFGSCLCLHLNHWIIESITPRHITYVIEIILNKSTSLHVCCLHMIWPRMCHICTMYTLEIVWALQRIWISIVRKESQRSIVLHVIYSIITRL